MKRTADPEQRAFGEYLHQRRRSCGFTSEVLAERCGLSIGTIVELESGSFTPCLITLRMLAYGFRCSVSDLFRGFEGDDPHAETAELVALVAGRGAQVISWVVELVRVFLRALDEQRRSS